MQKDFHYYATYSAAILAGFSPEDSFDIAYSAQFVDECSEALLRKLKGPLIAATTQLQSELMDSPTDQVGLQNITRIWASFHFLPRDLKAERKNCSKAYLNKFRLLCGPNGDLVKVTVNTARDHSLQAAGVAMHVLADTWAHRYFAGTPSLVLNNTDYHFYEIFPDGSDKLIKFRHSLSSPDDLENSIYTNSIYQYMESSIMNLGHGRAGHLPDYSFCRYRYLPAWGDYREIIKDNPADYRKAFTQMIYALKYLKGDFKEFSTGVYDEEAMSGLEEEIMGIIEKRQLDASADWKAFGEKLSGREIPDYDILLFQEEYMNAAGKDKDDTFLGRFFNAAIRQKGMVTNRIYHSGSLLAGYSLEE